MLVREFKYWRMFLFLLGITLHTFSISWMRNDRFDVKANIWLRFTSQRFRSSRFTSEYFTCSPFLSSRFTGLLPVGQVFVVFVSKVCVLLVRVCQLQSRCKYFLKWWRHLTPSTLFHFRKRRVSRLIAFLRVAWKHLNGVTLFF